MRGIYSILNRVNGYQYIGSSNDMITRYMNHITELRKGKHINGYLQADFFQYGIKNFKLQILLVVEDTITKEQLYALESKYIQECTLRYNIITDTQFNCYTNDR